MTKTTARETAEQARWACLWDSDHIDAWTNRDCSAAWARLRRPAATLIAFFHNNRLMLEVLGDDHLIDATAAAYMTGGFNPTTAVRLDITVEQWCETHERNLRAETLRQLEEDTPDRDGVGD